MPPNVIMYKAKYAFNGNSASSQLSFPPGASIMCRSGQEGNTWWWGSYNGREGWLPPAYVEAVAKVNYCNFLNMFIKM